MTKCSNFLLNPAQAPTRFGKLKSGTSLDDTTAATALA